MKNKMNVEEEDNEFDLYNNSNKQQQNSKQRNLSSYIQQNQYNNNKQIQEDNNNFKKISIKKKKSISFQDEQQIRNLSGFYVNKLKYYDYDSPTQISFRQLMYEDPFYLQNHQKPKKSAISILFTCKGFDEEIIEPIVKSGVKVTMLVDYVKSDGKQKQVQENYQNLKDWTVIYLQGDYGCFHPKLWLIQFPNFLRVVVGSGNLQIPHWTHWNNCLWYRDFLKISNKMETEIEENKIKNENQQYQSLDMNKDFQQQLISFVQGIMPSQYYEYQNLLGYDLNNYFYDNINIVLIPSMQGRFQGEDMNKYGFLRVKEVLLKFPPQIPYKFPIVTVQSSSVGNLNAYNIEEILSCLLPFNFYSLQDLKYRRQNNKLKSLKELRNQFQMIFPSKKYIEEESHEGKSYSTCMFFSKKLYNQENFAIQCFKAWESNKGQENTIPHLKTFIITNSDYQINDDTVIYFGSHNFTPSAFGKFENNFSSIFIANTELGGLFPPTKGSAQMKQQIINSLPFKFPPTNYSEDDRPFVSDLDFPMEN